MTCEIEDEIKDEVEQTFKFSDLSESAKQKARDDYTSRDYPYDDWWDSTYEDFDRIATILGVEIETSTRNSAFGKRTYAYQHIYFSGFWSQGDGASFEGTFRFNAKAPEEIRAYCNDEELFRIADALGLIQITARIQGKELPDLVTISTSSNSYSHSGNMRVTWNLITDGEEADIEGALLQLMRDLADWLYASLEKEHDYLMSNEVVDGHLDELCFDADGDLQS